MIFEEDLLYLSVHIYASLNKTFRTMYVALVPSLRQLHCFYIKSYKDINNYIQQL